MNLKGSEETNVKKKMTMLHNIPTNFMEPPPLVWLKKTREIDDTSNVKNEGVDNSNIETKQNKINIVRVMDEVSMSIDVPLISEVKLHPKIEDNALKFMPLYFNSLKSEDNTSYLQDLLPKHDVDRSLHVPLSNNEKQMVSDNATSGFKAIFSDQTKPLVKIKHGDDLEQIMFDVKFEDCEIKKELLHQELDIKLEDLEPDESSIRSTQDQHKLHAVPKRHQPHNQHSNKQKLKRPRNSGCQRLQNDYQTVQQRNLQLHKGSEEVNTFKCDQCDYKTVYKRNLKAHIIRRHKSPEEINVLNLMFKCDQCRYKTMNKGHFNAHLLLHKNPEDVEIFQCGQCTYNTTNKSYYRYHLLRHKNLMEGNTFTCDQCDFESIDKSSLRQHLLRHKDPAEAYVYKCDHCDFQSIRKNSLRSHLIRHKNPENVNIFICDQCDHRTLYKSALERHLYRHKNQEEYMLKCNECDYRSIRKDSLNIHLLRHKSLKEVNMVKCEQCDFKTFYKRNLKKHHLRHENPAEIHRYKCDHCDYQSIHKGTLKAHILRHRNPEKVMLKCDQCDYQCLRKDRLKIHLLRHKNLEELFYCDKCDYKTLFKCHYKGHLLWHKKSRESKCV